LARMRDVTALAGAPFQWVDGPLIVAMRQGDIILIDELNLAEDAVLERLNRYPCRRSCVVRWPGAPKGCCSVSSTSL
jgi:midasin